MEISNNQNKAVDDIVEMVVAVIGNGSREIDTSEAIASTARLAGSFLFRSFDFKIDDAAPGTVMLSQEANTQGPQLVNITHAVLHNMGVQIDDSKMSQGNQQKPAESDFVEVIGRMQKPALEIMQSNELNYEQLAQSAAIATAFIIQQSSNITPEQGLGTAIYHFIEGTKTFPPALEGEGHIAKVNPSASNGKNPNGDSKPWWKFW